MTYPQAQDLARQLSNLDTPPAKMLKTLCAQTGRLPTFIIMRYGDPTTWNRVPATYDKRRAKRERPKSLGAAEKIVEEVFEANGQAAVALRRRARSLRKTQGIKWSRPEFIVLKFGDPRLWAEVTKNLMSKKARRELSLARPCVLEHVKSGRVVEADSIVRFCQKAGIPKSRYHITPILDGTRPTHKGWYLPAFLDRTLHLRDIYLNEYSMSVRQWIKSGHSGGQAYRLLNGSKRTEMCSRLMLAETPVDAKMVPRLERTVEVKLTDGKRVFKGA